MATPYDVITDRIMTQLEAGTVPWRKPWSAGGFPRNLVSRREYRGVNVFLLSCAPYESPYWLTYRQAQELGGHVRKGEHGWPIVFWKWLEREDEDGEAKRVPLLRYYTGFNLTQCEGIPAEKVPATTKTPPLDFQPIAACEAVVQAMPSPPRLQHGFGQAAYSPPDDTVKMPSPERFTSAEHYYATLFHELTHSTGHKSRLARPGIADSVAAFGSPVYSREELVAEMGAAFLCGRTGIDTAPVTENHAAYVAGWLRALKADSKLVVMAAAQAQKAADFILGVKHEDHAEE